MDITVKFNLPDDDHAYKLFNKATCMASVLSDFKEQLRDWLKYGHEFKTADEALEKAREVYHELLLEAELTDI